MATFVRDRLRAHAAGLLLSFLAFFLGFGLGAAFGANEAAIKDGLANDGRAALATKYEGDAEKMQKVVSKSWSYMKRAHLHAGVLGACSMVMILALALVVPPSLPSKACSTLLGLGAPVYGLFWLLAAQSAPGLGSTGAGKDANEWAALLGSGSLIIGTVGAAVLITLALFRR